MRFLIIVTTLIFVGITSGCNTNGSITNDAWEVTPTFKYEAHIMRGIQNEIAIIDEKIIVDKPQLFRWHIWGDESQLSGATFKMVAVHKETNKKVVITENRALAKDISDNVVLGSATRYVTTEISLPIKGLWRFNAYIDNNLYGSIIIKANEKKN